MIQLDQANRRIISMFAENPQISQEELGHELGLSQPSVASRIKKLRNLGALESQVGINPAKMNLMMSKVDLTCSDTTSILKMFEGCPYFLNGFTISGKHNLCLFFVAENITTMEAIINGHLRPHEKVQEVEFDIIINSQKPLNIPLVLSPRFSNEPPCGSTLPCKACVSFQEKKCNGCPVTRQYQGWLF